MKVIKIIVGVILAIIGFYLYIYSGNIIHILIAVIGAALIGDVIYRNKNK